MFLQSKLSWNVIIPPENLDSNGIALQKAIVVRLMDDFATKKATKDLGYLLAITTLDKVGEGKIRERSGDVIFPVDFTCITFKVFKGEVLEGTVHKIFKHGVFLRTGPMDKVYLSHQKMPDYRYVPGENPIFISETSKIEKGVTVRYVVIGEKYVEAEGDFQAVVGLDGDFLGPV
ncbi:hypothetical protein ACH5RR_001999 [Cinchona calisaya]|uniref:DNA-directed RNA polymerase subunit n=1 Tax=Cinchona calisaya TaxID=153742 RepID=A0ABD3B5M4_9GENT